MTSDQISSLPQIIPRLQTILRRTDAEAYNDLMAEHPRPCAAYVNTAHEYWESEACFDLYEALLTTLDSYGVDLEVELNGNN